MRRLLLLAALTGLLLLQPAHAAAHVLVRDDSGQAGLIVHITPDDDPVAGEPASFFFDLQDIDSVYGNYEASFHVTDEQGITNVVRAQPAGPSSVAVDYTFPQQGLYKIELRVTVLGLGSGQQQSKTFRFSQLVSRGTLASPLDQPRYAWAEFLAILGSVGMIVVILIAVVRRKQILAYTKQY